MNGSVPAGDGEQKCVVNQRTRILASFFGGEFFVWGKREERDHKEAGGWSEVDYRMLLSLDFRPLKGPTSLDRDLYLFSLVIRDVMDFAER